MVPAKALALSEYSPLAVSGTAVAAATDIAAPGRDEREKNPWHGSQRDRAGLIL